MQQSISPDIVDTPIHPIDNDEMLLTEPHLKSEDIVHTIMYLLNTPRHVDVNTNLSIYQ